MSVMDILNALPAKTGDISRLCEIGKIKIGGKSSQERQTQGGKAWRAPEKHDYFTVTTLNRAPNGDLIIDKALMDQLIAKYGDPDGKLRQIPIRLLSDDIDDVMQSAFVWYAGKTCGARTFTSEDGKMMVRWFKNPRTNETYDPPMEKEWDPKILEWKKDGNSVFKVHTNFNCVIASQESRWGGVYRFRTTSKISLGQLYTSLLHLSQLTGGILMSMPLMLVLRPIQVAPDGKATTVYVVHVELRGADMVQIQNQALDHAKFRLTFASQIQKTQKEYRKLLAAPGAESAEEAADISEEFTPEDTNTIRGDTESKPFALLDGDDSGGAPPTSPNDAPQGEPPIPVENNEIPPDYIPGESPAGGAGEPDHNELDDLEREATVNELSLQEWPHFVSGWKTLLISKSGKEPAGFDVGVKMLIGKRKGADIAASERKRWIEASLDCRLNWSKGLILPAMPDGITA